VDVGPGPNSHTWGVVLLSKVSFSSGLGIVEYQAFRHLYAQFPIIKSIHHLLPSPYGELAPAIEATVNIYGTEVIVIVAHNGQGKVSGQRGFTLFLITNRGDTT